MSALTVRLTDDQVAHFHEYGFVSVDAITTPEELAWMTQVYDRLFAEKAGREEGNQFDLGGADQEGDVEVLPQILGPSRYAPELAQSLYRANAVEIARQLLGPEANYAGEHAILKPARFGAATPWHQDEAYWDPTLDYRSISIWMPLGDATVENGCLWFVPGSHRWEVYPHHSINNDPRVHGLEVDPHPDLDWSRAVPCPLPAGGATIHPSRTFHYAGPNTSDEPRRAYILGCATPAKKRDVPRDFYWNTAKHTPRQDRARGHQARQATKAESSR
ncbi:MAG: phytanoyl-CoA dioxygenase family protein [Armatimonadetes bacterium]|nr:phytanoyl-CoA dioxygenase family protein [Armatimonadota bacterium]